MHKGLLWSVFSIFASGAAAMAAPAAAVNPAGVDFFEKRVRPVLSQQCYKCHSATSEKLKGGLRLDSLQALLEGGDSGPAIVPGSPEKSLLITAINYGDEDMQMPPKNRLAPNVVADLTAWVKAGAPWPGAAVAVGPTSRPATGPIGPVANYDRLRKEHWAWQPLHESPTPRVSDESWPHGNIDRFVLAKMESSGIRPVADADKAALIRRVTFDLIGLPPTPDDVGVFVADASPDAYEKLVDRLLASPAFGERWGRHWLDIVRYGESTGLARNVPYPYAWRYRDYVINAFNEDKPYDRFLKEQIAGDLMPASSDAARREQLVATGFLAIGVKDLAEKDHAKYTMDVIDEQIDVTTRSIMALTVACARCHDHKFDPIPTADYYSLAGIFQSTQILAGVHERGMGGKKNYDAPELLLNLDAGRPAPVVMAISNSPAPAAAPARAALEAQVDALRSKLKSLQKGVADKAVRKAVRQQLLSAQEQLDSLGNAPPAAPLAAAGTPAASGSFHGQAMGAREGTAVDCAICVHGEPHDRGPTVPRGFISVVPVHSISSIDTSHSGRLELADWLTSQDNPLTPRVMANRIWGHLFGEGIVRTSDNFGSTGEAPVNPELLDYLAADFMKNGWSVKHLAREIVLSHAYQLSTESNRAAYETDPASRLCWRMPSRRLDAEEIRDAILAAGGNLDRSPAAGSVVGTLRVAELRKQNALENTSSDHRSVYLPILRDLVPPVLDLFDFAEPTMVIGSRDTTTVATQALFLLNDPFVTTESHKMADRLQNATGMDDAGRVDLAYRLALSRSPSPAERDRAMKYIADFQHDAPYMMKDSYKASKTDAWASFCQALMGSAEFRYLN